MRKLCVAVFIFLAAINWSCRRERIVGPGAQDRPNIIFLLADDMRFDALGCTGNPIAITPNLDALAAEGTNFKNMYATSPICAISRASIFTGQYARRHGINDFDKNLSASALQSSYPGQLRHYGYYTGFIGKYGVGNNLPSTQFDYWKGFPGHGVYFYTDANGKPVHETTFMEQEAEDFLAHRDKTKPFCLNISFKTPHSEDGVSDNNGFRPDPSANGLYNGVQFPYPETYADSFYKRFPAAWRKSASGLENEARLRWNMRFSTPDKFQTTSRAIYRLVSCLDKAVGQLRNYLKANGLDQNTIIVFTSDNGYAMGEHGLEGKWYGHEESIRLPLIVYDPRMPQQRKLADEMVLNIDLAPTILTWAKITVPFQMQGRALQPLLEANASDWRKEFFYEHPYDGGSGTFIPKSVGVVTQSWKYIRYYNGNTSKQNVAYEEFFDVTTDPHEKANRAKEAAQQSRLAECKSKVDRYEQCLR